MTIPNFISLTRILLVPVIIWLIVIKRYELAFFACVIAGVSDGIDGFIAKRFDQASELGAYLDALADKFLLVSIFVVLGTQERIPAWLVILVVSRDLLIIGALMLARTMDRPMEISPRMISKINTTAQIGLASIVLGSLAFGFSIGPIEPFLYWGTGLLTGASALVYLVDWLNHMADNETIPPEIESDGHPVLRVVGGADALEPTQSGEGPINGNSEADHDAAMPTRK